MRTITLPQSPWQGVRLQPVLPEPEPAPEFVNPDHAARITRSRGLVQEAIAAIDPALIEAARTAQAASQAAGAALNRAKADLAALEALEASAGDDEIDPVILVDRIRRKTLLTVQIPALARQSARLGEAARVHVEAVRDALARSFIALRERERESELWADRARVIEQHEDQRLLNSELRSRFGQWLPDVSDAPPA